MPVQRPYRVGPIQVLQKQTVNDTDVLQSPMISVTPSLTSLSHAQPSLLGKFEALAMQ